jgi:hypothetical protein
VPTLPGKTVTVSGCCLHDKYGDGLTHWRTHEGRDYKFNVEQTYRRYVTDCDYPAMIDGDPVRTMQYSGSCAPRKVTCLMCISLMRISP